MVSLWKQGWLLQNSEIEYGIESGEESLSATSAQNVCAQKNSVPNPAPPLKFCAKLSCAHSARTSATEILCQMLLSSTTTNCETAAHNRTFKFILFGV